MTGISNSILDSIGNTPLIRLNRLSDESGCEILGKAEFMNPGGSVKDRPAKQIIDSAVESGALRPGGIIVEGTAGNTGIGLAMVGVTRGFRVIIVMPDNQSQAKMDAVRYFGAELMLVPAAPYRKPNNFIKVSGRLVDQLNSAKANSAIWANQFDNRANELAHYRTTGVEIWEQTHGRVDAFICSVGSGGTLAGTSAALREHKADVTIGLADPDGASMYHLFNDGELRSSEGNSITEGIGQGRMTEIIEQIKVDHAYKISDSEALPYIYDLMLHEGMALGLSTAINLAGAARLARDIGPGKCIVTILCDRAERYQEKLFDLDFLRAADLPTPKLRELGSDISEPLIDEGTEQ